MLLDHVPLQFSTIENTWYNVLMMSNTWFYVVALQSIFVSIRKESTENIKNDEKHIQKLLKN